MTIPDLEAMRLLAWFLYPLALLLGASLGWYGGQWVVRKALR